MLLVLLFAMLLQDAPATRPADAADPTLDWVIAQGKPATAPADEPEPATAPATSPFAPDAKNGERLGTLTLSDGTTRHGPLATTVGKPLRVYVEADKKYVDVDWASVKSIEVEVIWERDEPEYRFKESGSDVKILTGKTYPARETEYALTLDTGDVVRGAIVAPLYLATEKEPELHVLNKRAKGPTGKKLAELVYVTKVELE